MSDIREELARAFALDDKARADAERDEWQCAQRTKRLATPAGVNRAEWIATRSKPKPMPPPQQQASVMDPVTQQAWDRWVMAHIENAFAKRPIFSEKQTDALAEGISLIRADERDYMREYVAEEIKKQIDAEAAKLREEISGLRMDTVVGRSVLRGEINKLREASMKKKARA